jgi:hypothetical protein
MLRLGIGFPNTAPEPLTQGLNATRLPVRLCMGIDLLKIVG